MNKMFKDRKGAVLVIVAVALVFIFGMTALVTDVGLAYAQRRHLSNALDAAALAGAQELPYDSGEADRLAKIYLVKNDVDPADVQVIIAADNSSIELIGLEVVPLFFAKVIGYDTVDVGAKAKVIVGPLSTIGSGIRPFIIENLGDDLGEIGYTYGDSFVIKEEAGEGLKGNFLTLGLGQTLNEIQTAITYGYPEPVSIGDMLPTEPGNAQPFITTVDKLIKGTSSEVPTAEVEYGTNPRIWIVPVTDDDLGELAGSSIPVKVSAFAMIFIEDIVKDGGHTVIKATFLRQYVPSTDGVVDLDLTTTGPIGINLVAY
jgi:hypothetical protein